MFVDFHWCTSVFIDFQRSSWMFIDSHWFRMDSCARVLGNLSRAVAACGGHPLAPDPRVKAYVGHLIGHRRPSHNRIIESSNVGLEELGDRGGSLWRYQVLDVPNTSKYKRNTCKCTPCIWIERLNKKTILAQCSLYLVPNSKTMLWFFWLSRQQLFMDCVYFVHLHVYFAMLQCVDNCIPLMHVM